MPSLLQRAVNFARKPKLASVRFWVRNALGLNRVVRCCVLHRSPLIVFAHTSDFRAIIPLLAGANAHLFVNVSWTLHAPDRVENLRQAHAEAGAGGTKLTVLANSEDELEIAQRAGFNAVFCNQNFALDERVFRILAGVPKKYDAIYDARLTYFKRHELAAEVRNLAVITYVIRWNYSDEYTVQTQALLKKAAWLNDPASPNYKLLSAEEICRHINESRVGLMLSNIEGPNYAITQYLLCGVPQVTTKSIGGRHVFDDPYHTIVAEDSPSAVAAGVQEMIRRKPDPERVREIALATVRKHRAVFIAEVEKELRARGCSTPFNWEAIFVDKLIRPMPERAFKKIVAAAKRQLR